MEHLKNFFLLIVTVIGIVLAYCGLTFIGVVSKIIDWFA